MTVPSRGTLSLTDGNGIDIIDNTIIIIISIIVVIIIISSSRSVVITIISIINVIVRYACQSHRRNRNPRPQPNKFSKLVFLIELS